MQAVSGRLYELLVNMQVAITHSMIHSCGPQGIQTLRSTRADIPVEHEFESVL